MFLSGNNNLRSAPLKAVADRKPLELKIKTKNDQGLVCMVLAYPSYLNSLLQLPWSINPIGKTSLNGIFTLLIYATSGVSWIVVLIVPFENKTGFVHHAGSFFFTTNLKNEKGGKHISWPIWGALHQLPTFVPFVSLISLIPNHRRRFGFPTSAPSPDWKASEAWWNHPRVQWMVLHKSFEKSRGFWILGSRPSVDRETLEKMAWKWTNLCEKTGMTLPSHGHGGQKLEGFGP